MKTRDVQKDFVRRLDSLRVRLKAKFPEFDVQNLVKIMGNIAHYHYNRRKFMVTGKEKELYDWLITNSYNPYTVYRWLLLTLAKTQLIFS